MHQCSGGKTYWPTGYRKGPGLRLACIWIFSLVYLLCGFSPLPFLPLRLMQANLKSVEVYLRNLDIARTWQVSTCVWPGSHSQWPALVYPRHVSAPYCLHFSAPAIAVSVNAAGGVAMTATIALYCGCHTQPFSVPAATSPVTTQQTPFRLHWCMCWSSRHDSLQLNDILVWCCCSVCIFMEMGMSLSGSLLRPQMHVQVWQVSLQTHDTTFESHLVPTLPANTTVSRNNISHAFRYLPFDAWLADALQVLLYSLPICKHKLKCIFLLFYLSGDVCWQLWSPALLSPVGGIKV